MKEFTKEEIIKFADKLLIGLTDEEVKTIYDEFAVINENIEQINKINLDGLEPAFMPYDLYVASLREDNAEASSTIDELLSNAKDIEGREIRVPKVVGGSN